MAVETAEGPSGRMGTRGNEENAVLRVFGEKEKGFHPKVPPYVLISLYSTSELILNQNNKFG